MCKAREIFCRHHHCCGVVGWHILQPCPGSYLADCVADHFFDNTRWNWLVFTSGSKVPEVASRQRCTFRRCIDCVWTAMKDAIAHADDLRDGGDPKDLFRRRITRAREQGRDLLCEVGLRGRDEASEAAKASEAANTAAGSEGEVTPYEYTPQARADTAFLATDHNPAASPAGSGSAEGQTCRNGAVADAACADGPGGLGESLLMAATTSPSDLLRDELVLFPEFDPVFVDVAHTGGPVVSADFGLGLNVDLGGNLNLEDLDLELDSDPGDLNPGNFNPEPDAASAELLQFPWEGDVLDQSDEFWDALVGPDDGSMAYIFGNEAAGAAGTKRQWLADRDDAWGCSSGSSHKKQRF